MASTKIWNIEGRNIREDQTGLSEDSAAILAQAIAEHTALWNDEPDHERICGACGDPLVKGFAHTAGCSSLWAIWPI